MDDATERIETAKAMDLRDVALRLGIRLGRGGKTMFCPAGHGRGASRGGTPSASLSKVGGIGLWCCHSCGAGGTVLDLVMVAQETDFRGAVDWLSGPLPALPPMPTPLAPLEQSEPVTQDDRTAALEAFLAPLTLNEAGQGWLSSREIGGDTAAAMGLVDTTSRISEAFAAAVAAVGREAVVALGLGAERKRDGELYCAWSGGGSGRSKYLLFPYRDSAGRVLHIQGRNLSASGKGPRWRHLKGRVPAPWGLDLCADADRVWIVEGCSDALALHVRGRFAVGVPGTGWLRPSSAIALTEWAAGRPLVLALDSDDAGREAQTKYGRLLRDAGATVLDIEWPDGFEGDWCDWFAEQSGWPGILSSPALRLEPVPDVPSLPAVAPVDVEERLSYRRIRDYTGRGKRCVPGPADVFLTRSKSSRLPHASAANVRSVLGDDVRLDGSWWLDKVGGVVRWGDDPVTDAHYVALKTWLDAAYGLRVSTSVVAEQIAVIAERNARDLIVEYLESLEWDGVRRAERWLADRFGAEDTLLHTEYSARWLIGCVARAMKPGCKLDTALVLVGPQGIRKSTAMRTLVGEDWYSDTEIDLESKDALMRFEGSWVIELPEMSSFHRARVDAVKAVLSSQVDVYRKPYGRELVRVPRRAVLIGSENRPEFLRDETGNRRWWPVHVTRADLEGLAEDRDQLWAEAVMLWRSGEAWHLEAEAVQEQADSAERFASEDPWSEDVLLFVEDKMFCTTADVLDRGIKMDVDRRDSRASRRVAAILRRAGWSQSYTRDGGRKRRVWRREA